MLADFNTPREGVVDDGYIRKKLVLSNKLEPTKKWLPSDEFFVRSNKIMLEL